MLPPEKRKVALRRDEYYVMKSAGTRRSASRDRRLLPSHHNRLMSRLESSSSRHRRSRSRRSRRGSFRSSGFWDDLKNGVTNAVHTVFDPVSQLAQEGATAVKDAVTTGAHVIETTAETAGDALSTGASELAGGEIGAGLADLGAGALGVTEVAGEVAGLAATASGRWGKHRTHRRRHKQRKSFQSASTRNTRKSSRRLLSIPSFNKKRHHRGGGGFGRSRRKFGAWAPWDWVKDTASSIGSGISDFAGTTAGKAVLGTAAVLGAAYLGNKMSGGALATSAKSLGSSLASGMGSMGKSMGKAFGMGAGTIAVSKAAGAVSGDEGAVSTYKREPAEQQQPAEEAERPPSYYSRAKGAVKERLLTKYHTPEELDEIEELKSQEKLTNVEKAKLARLEEGRSSFSRFGRAVGSALGRGASALGENALQIGKAVAKRKFTRMAEDTIEDLLDDDEGGGGGRRGRDRGRGRSSSYYDDDLGGRYDDDYDYKPKKSNAPPSKKKGGLSADDLGSVPRLNDRTRSWASESSARSGITGSELDEEDDWESDDGGASLISASAKRRNILRAAGSRYKVRRRKPITFEKGLKTRGYRKKKIAKRSPTPFPGATNVVVRRSFSRRRK